MKHSSIIGFLCICILFSVFSLNAQQLPQLKGKYVKKSDFTLVKNVESPIALKAKKSGLEPGVFKGVSTKLKSNVIILDSESKTELVKSINNKGVIPTSSLRKIKVAQDKIYLDEESNTVFTPSKYGKDSLILIQPSLNLVLKEFKIPKQRVQFNLANTSYSVNNVDVSDENTYDGGYLMKMEFKDTLYKFKKEIKKDGSKTTIDIEINLDGYLYIKNPEVEASYSKNNGYYFSVYFQEEANITAKANFKLKSEVSIPIWAFDIPAGKYGNCKVGIFAFIDVDGKVELEYKIIQNLDIKAGLKGKTLFYFPKSYSHILEVNKNFGTEYKISGELKVFGGVQVVGDIKVYSYDLVKVVAKGGLEFEVKTSDNAKNFEAELGARIKIEAKLKKISKNVTLLNKYYKLWERKKTNYGGYILEVKSADAYNDRVWGLIYKEKDTTPYVGDITLIVVKNNNSNIPYEGKTDNNGIFALTNIPLVKGDVVKVKIKESPNPSKSISVSIPFKEIVLNYADYTSNEIHGAIASNIDWFPKTNPIEQVGNAGVVSDIIKDRPGIIDMSKVLPPSIISENIFKKAINYNGDISVSVSSLYHKVGNMTIPNLNNIKKDKPPTTTNKIEPLMFDIKKKVINMPFGLFRIENVDIKPMDKVKVSINIDGFVIESNEVYSDGIIITPSIDIDKEGGILSSTIKANNSFVTINSLRGNKVLNGKIKMIKGIDMKHSSPKKTIPIQQFTFPKIKEISETQKPLVYYNLISDLKPGAKENKYFFTAKTGPWEINNIFYDMRNQMSINKFDGHRFEYISYTFEGRPVFYKYYQEKCNIDKGVNYDNLGKIKNKPKIKKNIQEF